MTEFEFIFALYALALGLSLVEILSGLGGRSNCASPAMRVGRSSRSAG